MRKGQSWFNTTSVALGFAFLYAPIVILVIYSFNDSKLVTVWGGFSTHWYGALMANEPLLDAAWLSIRLGIVSARAGLLGVAVHYALKLTAIGPSPSVSSNAVAQTHG